MKTVTVNSNNKDDAYTATVHYFTAVQSLSRNNIDGWTLGEVYTSNIDQHFITTYTNGKMWVKAVSIEGEHTYSFGA